MGHHCYEIWADRFTPCEDCPVVLARESGEPRKIEKTTPDGRSWNIQGYPVRNEENQITGMVELTLETTDQRKAEEALLGSESRFRLLLESTAEAIYGLDKNGVCTFVNPACMRFLGYENPETLVGKKLHHLIHHSLSDGSPYEEKTCCICHVLHTGEGCHADDELFWRADGKPLSVEYWSYPIMREDRIEGAVVTFLDITERKAAEEERQRLEAQLRRAQKLEAVGTMASGIAHDFNNLLQAVQGYAEVILLDTDESFPGYGELKGIVQAAKKGSELTRQILTFSRKIDVELRPLNLNLEVKKTCRLLERTIPKMIAIKLNLAHDLRIVSGDPTQIEQVLVNLAMNAKDAMPEGGALILRTMNVLLDEVFLKTHPEASTDEYVLLELSDTGMGMDEATQEHIFDPFFTTKGRAEGTGLGLATTYGIVKNHGGYITCTSEPGKGTTFRVYFPAVDQEAAPEKEAPEPRIRRGSETILIIDDEPIIRELGQKILERYGYRVLTAFSGRNGLVRFQKEWNGIDLVILDLIMPGMGGKQCLEELLKIDPEAKVLIASGFSEVGSMREMTRAGAKNFIAKPYEMRRLLRVVRETLDEKKRAAEGAG